MFCSPVILPYPSWVVSYDANGVLYWVPLIPANLVHVKEPVKQEAKPKPDQMCKTYRTRIGEWEEVYDVVDGTKTWYNTATKNTTKKDPFV